MAKLNSLEPDGGYIMLFNDVPFRALSFYKAYSVSSLLVLNGTSLNIYTALLGIMNETSITFIFYISSD